MTSPRFRRSAGLVLVTGAALALTACGTRLTNEQASDQLLQASRGGVGSLQGSGVGLLGSQAQGGGARAGDTTSLGHNSASGATAGGAPTDGRSGAHSSAGGGNSSGGSGPVSGGGGAGGGNAGGSGGTDPAAAAKTPIVLGMVGNFSGVLGAAYARARDAALAWGQETNAKGGIDGHPLTLLVADNGNNASNDIAQVRRLVEEEGAIAIWNFFPAPGSEDVVGKYAQDKGIAIVGGSGIAPAWTKYLGMFPAVTGDMQQDRSWALAMKDSGVTKVGSLYCAEVQICADKEQRWADKARSLGLDVVYQGTGSLAQPDYTSNCTAARSNGAEAVVTILDGNSTLRYAHDCARQQYKQTIIITAPTNDVTPELEGGIAPITSFPWFLTSGTPALDEYGAALNKYVKTVNTFTSMGWLSGKMLERALTGRVSNPPRPSDVLDGMYSFHGETLGGLSQPLTFTRGKPATAVPCAWKAVVKSGKWTAPSGLTATYCS